MDNFYEFFTGFDYIDEIVYVTEMETYELVYCNKKAAQVFGLKERKNCGNKCYECVQGFEQPCVFCNNDKLKKNKRCIRSRTYPKTGMEYLLFDSVITISEKQYRLELALEKSFLDETEVQAYQMLEVESYLTTCIRRLVKAEDFSSSVSTVLQTILNYYNGDRTYLFEFDWKKEVASNTYEICATDITAEINNLQNIPIKGMEFWTDQFCKKETLVVENIELIKEDPSRRIEYKILASQGINSIIAVPFFFGQRMAGFIGVDNPKQNFKNEEFLINLAYFIGVEIEKHNVVHELLDSSCKDSLTGVYNRRGFEQIVNFMPAKDHPIAFGIVDIDHFKLINDSYGHSVGDTILKEVAELLSSVSRTDDTVFRLGGDEFVILLNNCTAEAWNTICMKLKYIHSNMLENHAEMTITLSIGMCFSTNGFNEDIYKMADEALYYIKRNGRAGCAMIQESTREKRYWFDDISTHMKNILESNDTVLFRVELPKKQEEKPIAICGNTARNLFGFPMDVTVEECYQRWIDGIDPSYFDAMIEMQKQMMNGIQAECTYLWNHPEHGKINIRTIGSSENVKGTRVIYGYHHFLRDTKIIERDDDSKQIINAISKSYAGSYYINLKDYSYISLKSAPNEHLLKVQQSDIREDFQKYLSVLIQPEYKKRMEKFLDLETLGVRLQNQNQLDCEYRSYGDNRWYRATFVPVKVDANDKLTHVLYEITLLDQYASQQSERNVLNEKVRMESLQRYEAQMTSLAGSKDETLSMCRINLTKNTYEILNNSDVMEPYTRNGATYEKVVRKVADRIVGEETKKKYLDMLQRDNLLKQAEKGNWHQELEYLMHVNESHYEWITAVVDLVKNPINGEISGVAYCKSSQASHMTDALLKRTLENDCLFAAAIFVATDEFYVYNPLTSSYMTCMQDFWNVAIKENKLYCSDETVKELKEFFVKENILEQLKHKRTASFGFDSIHTGTRSRLEVRFSYLDESHTMLLGVMRDVTDNELFEKYRYDSEHDLLTHLFNRSKFMAEAERLLKEDTETTYALVHFDIKNFHLYNTFFGEEAGDQLLCDLAKFIREGSRDYNNAIYSRIEADVFAALLPFEKEKYENHANLLRQKVRNYRNDFLLEPKIGIYLIDKNDLNMEAMFTRASIAAKSIKITDSDIIAYYNESMEQKLHDQQSVVNEMQTALENEQFKVFLQGKYALSSKKRIGAEALVRWQHPIRGLVSPAKFIPVFEGNGFIMELDRYMWEHTCQVLYKWKTEGKDLLPISVNVSRISIFNPTTVGFLKELVQKYDINPKYLELELTESAYVENPEIIKPRLHELQEYGFVISMDDFGSGYSSLNILNDLPVDILKLDMKFLNATDAVEKSEIVLSTIIDMANKLHLVVVAEGVETQKQADKLFSMGCEYVQGFLFAKPVPIEEFEMMR